MEGGLGRTARTIDAPAKVNLALHVAGQRPDGYHELDSLVAFCTLGDQLSVEPGSQLSLSVTGPFSDGLPAAEDNLVLKAAHALRDHAFPEGGGPGAAICLTKNLPVAGGIGGGSADAAAALRSLNTLWQAEVGNRDLERIALRLGADIPVCLTSAPRRMRGIGEVLTPLPPLSPWPVVLLNPGVPLSTADVFSALDVKTNPGLPEPDWHDRDSFIAHLTACRNDLEGPACRLAPVIVDALRALRSADGCLFARMSGSGSTIFGLFESDEKAEMAAGAIQKEKGWWAAATKFCDASCVS